MIFHFLEMSFWHRIEPTRWRKWEFNPDKSVSGSGRTVSRSRKAEFGESLSAARLKK
jgi:hypothetical protein